MGTEIELPDYLKKMLDDGSAKVDTSMISQTDSVPRISLKGRRFRFKVSGDEIKQTGDPINVIIVGVTPENAMSKTFYIAGYNPDSSDPPDCSSDDGVSPNSWSQNKQSEVCATCENNAWGSATSMSGGKAKACKDSKRLYVVDPLAEPNDDGTPLIFLLNITVASLKALSEYGKTLNQNGIPHAACITQVSFVDSDFPQIQFEFKGCLKEEMGTKFLGISADKPWEQQVIRTDNMVGNDKSAAMPSQAALTKEPTAKAEPKVAKVEKEVKGEVVPDDAKPTSDVDDILNQWTK